jgi:hypothetical protein
MMDELNRTDLSDDEAVARWFDGHISEVFVRQDRRRLIGVPEASRDAFFGQITSWASVADGQPTFTIEEVLDVREDWLLLCRLSIGFPPGPLSEQLQVLVYDPAVERVVRMMSFDPDALAEAHAELDRVHAGTGADET